ncbi:uncharacterized protein LOC132942377 [Metopolophium dirhodum]|uniref:uncharacterized protein LOC132942377 n=1 Tax=Metopolophium dirhodum TaxID=44670 RepID=UPI0029900C1C|nr:uncharacterized protein LOC132942377 [Metopolophium dirhodum]
MDGFKSRQSCITTIEEDSNQSCIITIEEDTKSIMYSKIISGVLTVICVGLLVTIIMLLNPNSRRTLAFSNGTMDNGTNIESTEGGGLLNTVWKAVRPIISPDTAASELSVANATKFRINHNNNNHNNISYNIVNNYYNCNHKQ